MDETKERSWEAVRCVWVRPADWSGQNREWAVVGGGERLETACKWILKNEFDFDRWREMKALQ